jgi:hypothetical protein
MPAAHEFDADELSDCKTWNSLIQRMERCYELAQEADMVRSILAFFIALALLPLPLRAAEPVKAPDCAMSQQHHVPDTHDMDCCSQACTVSASTVALPSPGGEVDPLVGFRSMHWASPLLKLHSLAPSAADPPPKRL